MALNQSQAKERSEYLEKHLNITECSQGRPYVFISYASDNWETVFKNAVVPMQQQYGLCVYADKAFDKVNDKWIVPMLRNIRGAEAVVAFVSQSYIESYACFLELLTAVNNKKPVVFVSLEQELHLGVTTDQPEIERGVKNEILNQGANISTNTNNTSNDIMRAMKSAFTSISTLLEQDALSKYDISDAFINFFRDASINRKTINDLRAVKRTIKSISGNVFDKSLIVAEAKPAAPVVQPVQPVQQFVQPVQPAQPMQQTQPVQPVQPAQPIQQTPPVQPSQPIQQTQPVQPAPVAEAPAAAPFTPTSRPEPTQQPYSAPVTPTAQPAAASESSGAAKISKYKPALIAGGVACLAAAIIIPIAVSSAKKDNAVPASASSVAEASSEESPVTTTAPTTTTTTTTTTTKATTTTTAPATTTTTTTTTAAPTPVPTGDIKIVGALPQNIKNDGIFCVADGIEYRAFYIDESHHKIYGQDTSGNSDWILKNDGGQFNCLNYYNGMLYYIQDESVYQLYKTSEGWKFEKVDVLKNYSNVTNLYVAESYYFIYSSGKLYRVSKSNGDSQSIAISGKNNFTFSDDGWLYYTGDDSDGKVSIFRTRADDFKQESTYHVYDDSGSYSEPVFVDGYLYVLWQDDTSANIRKYSNLYSIFDDPNGTVNVTSYDISEYATNWAYALNVSGDNAFFAVYDTDAKSYNVHHVKLNSNGTLDNTIHGQFKNSWYGSNVIASNDGGCAMYYIRWKDDKNDYIFGHAIFDKNGKNTTG